MHVLSLLNHRAWKQLIFKKMYVCARCFVKGYRAHYVIKMYFFGPDKGGFYTYVCTIYILSTRTKLYFRIWIALQAAAPTVFIAWLLACFELKGAWSVACGVWRVASSVWPALFKTTKFATSRRNTFCFTPRNGCGRALFCEPYQETSHTLSSSGQNWVHVKIVCNYFSPFTYSTFLK